MFANTGSSVHDLVIVVAFMGALFSGYAGMTIWARKGGKPAGGFLVGGLLGPWAYSSSPQPPRARQKSTAPPDLRGSPRIPTARSSSKARRGCAGTVSVTSRPRPRPTRCDRRPKGEAPICPGHHRYPGPASDRGRCRPGGAAWLTVEATAAAGLAPS
jgi:hypothetical protein